MRRITKFSSAALALFVVAAHPEDTKQVQSDTTRSQQEQLSKEQRNQQSTFDPQRVSDSELKKSVTELNKASTFTKMAVQNMQNEKLGTVNDLVFDPETGKISYAVLSVGGFLGVGDKLVAVPLTSLRPQPGQNYLVLNMTKDELTSAPGLAKNNWPKLNDPSLGSPASSETSSASSKPSSSSSGISAEGSISAEPNKSDTGSSDISKSSDKLSSSSSTPSSSSAKDAQGSSPSTSTSSGSSSDKSSTETSGKDAGASGSQSSGSNSDSSSSSPKS